METALADATQATGAVGDEIGRLVVGENDWDLLVTVRVITMNKGDRTRRPTPQRRRCE